MREGRTRILMTGGGAPGAPGILKCLKQDPLLDIFVADANPHAVGRYLNQDFFSIPRADDPLFIDTVLESCLERGIKIIMPLVTRELFLFAREKKRFEQEGISVLVSEENALNIANNKSRLVQFLEMNRIAVPEFRVAQSYPEFELAVKELGYPFRKVCFKPSVSNGSRGFRIIDDAVNSYDLLFNHKPNSTYISYKEISGILEKHEFPELLVSEVLPGEEFSVDCLVNHGKCVIAIPRIRTRMNNGISVEGEFIKEPDIIHYSTQIVEAIGLHGNIGVQVKRSESGKFLVLEINPRVQGTIVSGLGAGVNLPMLAVQQELGYDIRPEDIAVRWGTKFIRYWEEVFYK
ncbi:MAG: ATP-grasp domain-containing protein [Bacteroidetes bacterium]|nr:MAG: ATP-grasp domain-containing protein [Bacteroidota bacterium]REK07667.1 MAG: ATP-grasp domain-containing protein [Bacteroidota bacterium]REK33733.1 MAG: ATP-grasp domain-containing protein [Bacteroidota bacterium]REK49203.1 MAG: ATP-grasp domain-containing protein [Bacteroidota bacterium]